METGRRVEMDYVVGALKMFEFGSLAEATNPTTTSWVDRVKINEEGREFVRCRLVVRDVRPRTEAADLFTKHRDGLRTREHL